MPATGAECFGEGGHLVATTKHGTTRLFDAETGEPRGTIGSGFSASLALFDPGGRHLALVGADAGASEAAGIWDVESRDRLHVLYSDSSHPELTLATFSPNGRRLAVAGWDGSGAILAADGRSRPLSISQSDEIRSVAFSPDGARVLTVSADRQAIVWDAATGRWLDVLSLTGQGNGGAFSPDGRWIATAADDNVLAQLWDAATGVAAAGLGGARPFVDDVVFSPDGRLVAVRDDTGRILVWELEPGGREVGSAPRTGGRIRLGAGAGTVTVLSKNSRTLSTPLVWRTQGVTVRLKLGARTDARSPNREFLAFVPDDGQYLTVDIFDRKTKRQSELRHDGEVESVAWSPDTTFLATASDDGAARVWTSAGGQVSIERGHQGAVASVAFNPDGELLVTAGADDGTARVWDVASGDQLAVLGGGPGAKRLDAAALSPDGRLVVTRAVDGSVAVYSCGICGSLDELIAIGRSRTHVVRLEAG